MLGKLLLADSNIDYEAQNQDIQARKEELERKEEARRRALKDTL